MFPVFSVLASCIFQTNTQYIASNRYLNDFSKALASEVRILLQEVGKLRDERRALQQYVRPVLNRLPECSLTPSPPIPSEIAELMAVKAKHSAGGEYSPDWRPKVIHISDIDVEIAHPHVPSQYLPEELMPSAPTPPPPPPPEEDFLAPEGPARPAWRTVVKRPEPGQRRKGKAAAAAPPPPPPPPPPVMEAPRPELPSWAQWRREHAFLTLRFF